MWVMQVESEAPWPPEGDTLLHTEAGTLNRRLAVARCAKEDYEDRLDVAKPRPGVRCHYCPAHARDGGGGRPIRPDRRRVGGRQFARQAAPGLDRAPCRPERSDLAGSAGSGLHGPFPAP